MAFMNWNDGYSIGIESIDSQHKKLIAMVNSLHEAMFTGKGSEYLKPLLKDLTEYTITHFAYEEGLLTKNGYPQYTGHKKEHDKLIEEVKGIQADLEANVAGLSIKVMEFLSDWLLNHIMKVDMAYSSFLIEKGVK